MQTIRDLINKNPWLGWVVAIAVMGVSVWLYTSRSRGDSPYSPDRMTEMVTIRFTDTDEEIKMPRGRLDKELRGRGMVLDPKQGILNPKTGKFTGFLVDDAAWTEMVDRINREKAEAQQKTPRGAVRREPVQPPPSMTEPAATPPAGGK